MEKQEYIRVMQLPDTALYQALKVSKETKLKYENEILMQTLENLVFTVITKTKGEKFESETKTTIFLNDGDIVIYENNERGYVVPVEEFKTVDEVIKELELIKEV